jgi:hypothetical protein
VSDSGPSSGQAREMNDPQDRPPASDRPAPYDPPDRQAPAPAPGGPPGDPAGEPVESFGPPPPPPPASPGEPEARWEDVVDPQLETPAAPPAQEWPEPNRVRPAPRAARPTSAPAPAATGTLTAEPDDDYDDDYDDDEPASRWVSLLATIGTALIGIVTVQVLTSLVEGFTLQSEQRVGVPDDLLHRLGYPFGGLGATALVFLVLGVVLVSMPSVLDELLSESQDRVVGIALIVAIIMAVLIAIGSLLAVRANLHEYSAKNVPVPSYVRVQFTNFLLGSLGAAALALFGSIAAMNERSREQSSL